MSDFDEYKYEVKWYPEKDITTWELAQCIPYMFTKLHEMEVWDKLDRSITRHFLVSHYNYSEYIRKSKEAFNALDDDIKDFLRR
jgi:hypothetical protein